MIRAALILVVLATAPALAADPLPPELALVPPDAGAFVSVRWDLVGKTALGKGPLQDLVKKSGLIEEIEKHWLAFPVADIERATMVYPGSARQIEAHDSPVFIVTSKKKIDRLALIETVKAQPFFPEKDEDRAAGIDQAVRPGELWRTDKEGGAMMFAGDRTLMIGLSRGSKGGASLLHLLARRVDPSPEAPLAPVIAEAARDNVLVAGISGDSLDMLLRAIPEKPAEYAPLARATMASVIVHLEPDFRIAVRVSFPDADSARDAQPAAAKLLRWIHEFVTAETKEVSSKELALIGHLLGGLKAAGEPKVDGKDLVLTVRTNGATVAKLATDAYAAGVARLEGTLDSRTSANNLKQMCLAFHNFHDTFGYFPFKDLPKESFHPGLSWRVAILPFIEQDNLYRQFHLDEPWDSEHNKQFVEKMPKVYAPPADVKAKAGHTFYRVFDGPGTMARMKTLTDITDGTANTIAIVEAGEAVIWTKPDEIEYDPTKPLPKLGGHFPDGFHAAFADGSVKFVKKGVDEKLLRAWITANGGEPIPVEKK